MTMTTSAFELTFTPLAESALLVCLGAGEQIDPIVVDAVTALTHALDAAAPIGLVDVVPAYCTILIEFDVALTDGDAIEAEVRAVVTAGIAKADREARVAIVPVLYGGERGPDLEHMAELVGLSAEEVAERHAAADYRVACMGFSPGWAYLMGLPPELTVPRRSEPRTRIPAGSVAVGGAQTGVYPLESPGGWHLIGRTPLKMFDPTRARPFLLEPGDHVRFAPIDEARYQALERVPELP